MKYLNGGELAEYIKERQIKQVRALRQAEKIEPKLAIVIGNDDPIINKYVGLKKNYGLDVWIDVELFQVKQSEISQKISELNKRDDIHGIIVQLPLADPSQTDEIINRIDPEKDVDGLGRDALFASATPTAIDWLLVGYNKDLKDKKIVIIGQGRLVGDPLYKMWSNAGHDVTALDKGDDLAAELRGADIIVTATGQPGIIKSEIIPIDSVVVDAGVASEDGVMLGDLDPAVYERDDLTITPKIGGVGPLTVAALFDNVIRAASRQ